MTLRFVFPCALTAALIPAFAATSPAQTTNPYVTGSLRINEGQIAPGAQTSAMENRLFSGFKVPTINNAGLLEVGASCKTLGANTGPSGLWRHTGTALGLEILQGDAVIGWSNKFKETDQFPSASDTGDVFFAGESFLRSDYGLFLKRAGQSPIPIALRGDPTPDMSGAVFAGLSGAFGVDSAGTFHFTAQDVPPPMSGYKPRSLWTYEVANATFTRDLAEGDAVAGFDMGTYERLLAGSATNVDPFFSTSGARALVVKFDGELTPAVSISGINDYGIVFSKGLGPADYRVVVQENMETTPGGARFDRIRYLLGIGFDEDVFHRSDIPGSDFGVWRTDKVGNHTSYLQTGDTITDLPGELISSTGLPEVNAQSSIATVSTSDMGTEMILYIESDLTQTVLAKVGDAVSWPAGYTISALVFQNSGLSINDVNQVAFTAHVQPPGQGPPELAVLATDVQGNLHTVWHKGMDLDGRTVTTGESHWRDFERSGQTTINDFGQIAARMIFTDGTEAVYVFEVNPCLDELCADRAAISTSGLVLPLTVGFEIAAPAYASELYVLLGSASGASPGFFPAAGVHVPLNMDAYFDATLPYNNPSFLTMSVGVLDGTGSASATLDLSLVPAALPMLLPSLVGLEIHHAAIILDGLGTALHATNAVATVFVP